MVFPGNIEVAKGKIYTMIMFVGELLNVTKIHLSYVANVLFYSVLNLYSMNGL